MIQFGAEFFAFLLSYILVGEVWEHALGRYPVEDGRFLTYLPGTLALCLVIAVMSAHGVGRLIRRKDE